VSVIFFFFEIMAPKRLKLLENLKEKKVSVEVSVEKRNRESIFQKAGKGN